MRIACNEDHDVVNEIHGQKFYWKAFLPDENFEICYNIEEDFMYQISFAKPTRSHEVALASIVMRNRERFNLFFLLGEILEEFECPVMRDGDLYFFDSWDREYKRVLDYAK